MEAAQKLNIGITIKHFTPNTGGLQWHAQRLVEGLAGLGNGVRVLTKSITTVPSNSFWFCDPPSNPSPSNVAILRRRVGSLPMLWLAHKFCGREATRALGVELYCDAYMPSAWSYLKNSQLVHHVGQGSEMIGFVAEKVARRAGVPFLVQPTIHPGHWGDSELDFMLYRRADRLLAHTDYERGYFRDKGMRMPIDVVGNGIDDRQDGDAARFRERHGLHGPVILFLGRKDPDKGYFSLREAHGLMRERATLVCVGPGGGKVESGNAEKLKMVGTTKDTTPTRQRIAQGEVECVGWEPTGAKRSEGHERVEEVLTTDYTTERLGESEEEQPKVGLKGEGVGTTESNATDGSTDAGPCLDKPSGAAFSNPFTSELARDSENTSLTRSASAPASLPVTSNSLPDTALEALPPVLELGFLSEDEKHDALAACDVFCVPSIGESFGLVYMEAGRYRKPIVCRPIPVLEELLQGAADFVGERVGQCGGRLDAAELAGALDALIMDASRRERLGEVAFKKSEKFLWPRVVEQFSMAYRKALAPRNSFGAKIDE